MPCDGVGGGGGIPTTIKEKNRHFFLPTFQLKIKLKFSFRSSVVGRLSQTDKIKSNNNKKYAMKCNNFLRPSSVSFVQKRKWFVFAIFIAITFLLSRFRRIKFMAFCLLDENKVNAVLAYGECVVGYLVHSFDFSLLLLLYSFHVES